MFICKPCHKKTVKGHAFDDHRSGSRGPCEVCRKQADCVDCK